MRTQHTQIEPSSRNPASPQVHLPVNDCWHRAQAWTSGRRHGWRNSRRRGLASLLSMLYLVLMSTLAVGFYAATSMSAQIARNERMLSQAESAADGGMQFIRYQLGQMTIPANVQPTGLMDAVALALAPQLNGSPNMNGHTVQNTGGIIYIPAVNDWTVVDSAVGTKFRAEISQSGQFVVVTVDGASASGSVMKAIQLQYQKAPKAGAILDYGVATEGTLATGGATLIQGQTDPTKGSVLSADMTSSTPISIGGRGITGDASVVNPSATISGAPIGGTSDPIKILQHEHVGVPAPTFPTVDTSVFTQYATTPYDGSGTCNNCYVPAGMNPTFSGGNTINGVLYIQAPNHVSFQGNTTINGVIVTDTGTGSKPFDAAANTISIAGNVTATPIEQLSPSNPAYNASLVKLTGSFLLAPNFNVSITGDFGSVSGSMVGGELNMTGNATGVVQGSVITIQDVPMTLNGHASITISSTGTSNYPTGMSFGNAYTPLPGTYIEVTPW
jgi:Tfp pilus assembly protein PilX